MISSTGYYFLKERKPNAALEYFYRGISLVNPSKSIDLSLQLYSMAGYAAHKSGDNKKSCDFHLCVADIIKSLSLEDTKYLSPLAIAYYNLSVSCSSLYNRTDAESYIAKSLELVLTHNLQGLKQKIIPVYEEFFGEVPIHEESRYEEVPMKMEFNFLPGAPEKNSNKIVELRSETPKERKRMKNSKRNFSRN